MIVREIEGTPASWPAVVGHHPIRDGETVDGDNPALDPAVTWQRIEAWIAHRWSPRSIEWIVEGPGEFAPPLAPFALGTLARWQDGWETVEPVQTALGIALDHGRWRIEGVVGGDAGPVPDAVQEAWRRLHEYGEGIARLWWTETANTEGVSYSFAAKGLHLSGAADLLRPWKRLGAS